MKTLLATIEAGAAGRSGRVAEGARVGAAGRTLLGRRLARPEWAGGYDRESPPAPRGLLPRRARRRRRGPWSRLGRPGEALEVLGRELGNKNLIVGHYAIWALEEIGAGSMPLLSQIQAARESPYDPTRRVAERLSKTLMAVRAPQPD